MTLPLVESIRGVGQRVARRLSADAQRELLEARAGNLVIDAAPQGGLQVRAFGDLEGVGRTLDAYDARLLRREGAAHTAAVTEELKALRTRRDFLLGGQDLRPLVDEPALGPTHSLLPDEELRLERLSLRQGPVSGGPVRNYAPLRAEQDQSQVVTFELPRLPVGQSPIGAEPKVTLIERGGRALETPEDVSVGYSTLFDGRTQGQFVRSWTEPGWNSHATFRFEFPDGLTHQVRLLPQAY